MPLLPSVTGTHCSDCCAKPWLAPDPRSTGGPRPSREADIERPQIAVQPGILERDHMGGRVRLVVMGVPIARRSHEGEAGLPVDAHRIDDLALVVKLGADQRVAALLAIDDEVEGDRLVTVRL